MILASHIKQCPAQDFATIDKSCQPSFDPTSLRTMEALRKLDVPFYEDNSVVLLPTGKEKFGDLFEAIRQARHYVHLEYFNYRNDSIGWALFGLLGEKAKEGVEVRVMISATVAMTIRLPRRIWTASAPWAYRYRCSTRCVSPGSTMPTTVTT